LDRAPPRGGDRSRETLLRARTHRDRRRARGDAERRVDRRSRARAPDVRRHGRGHTGAHRARDGASMTDAVTVRDLHKTFRTGFWGRKVQVLHGVSLSVRRGESLGLLGPNGAGKSTTLKCILRLVFPTAGEIEIGGGSNRSPEALAKV